MKTILHLQVNGESYDVYASAHKTLLEVLREDLGLIGVKHGCELGECGTCTEANIVLGAVASYPIKATDAEAMLVGQKLNNELIEEAANTAFKPAKPLDNIDMNHSYRKQMVRVYVKRALRECAGVE